MENSMSELDALRSIVRKYAAMFNKDEYIGGPFDLSDAEKRALRTALDDTTKDNNGN